MMIKKQNELPIEKFDYKLDFVLTEKQLYTFFMRIIFIGDIVGKGARETLIKKIPDIRSRYNSDVIIANAENSAGGYGLTKKIAVQLLEAGVDVITLGNHAWDQKEMLSYIEECPKIVRALNYPEGVPGKGYYEFELHDGRKITVVQVMLRLFMGLSLDDPFSVTKKYLQKEKLGTTTNAILIDMHGETTSEKNALVIFLMEKYQLS